MRPALAVALTLIAAPSTADTTAVVSAFTPEWLALQAAMEEPVETTVNGNRFVAGRLAGRDVVLLLSGISMVNAAMTTQLALDTFDIDRIVVTGIAGGVDPGLSIGDVVVPERWGQYLDGVFARETDGAFAMPPWMTSDFAPYGMMFTRGVEVRSDRGDAPETKFWFDADPALVEVARMAASGLTLADCAGDGTCLSHRPVVAVGGNGVSGARFVDNAAFRDYAFATFEARVLDMETAAVAHVAYANGVPFVAFRSLSDLAGGGDGANEMTTFLDLAAGNAATVVQAFLSALPAD